MNLDLLYIDAEGYDGEIILDFIQNIEIRPIFVFEYIHINHIVFQKVINLLVQNDYKILKCNENIVAFNKKFTINL